MPIQPPSSREDFKIAIICALTLEAKAVVQLFDATYDENLDQFQKAPGDNNTYTLGSIGKYHVILVYMPGVGNGYASSVATNVKRSYACLELALVVGVCGGVPYMKRQALPRQDIFLGDVIVSKGVVQHDLGRRYPTKFERDNTPLKNLPRPRPEILSFLNKLDVHYDRLANRLAGYLTDIQRKFPSGYPGAEKDRLFSPDYKHQKVKCKCAEYTHCDEEFVARQRVPVSNDHRVGVHFGLVASGNMVMMSAHDRDKISEIEDIIGFEMEGAGVWENLPCIVIKGVSDYADSHKTDEWQHFAAASAAACTRAILDETPVYIPNPSVGISSNHSESMTLAACRKRPAAEISESSYEGDSYIESLTFPQAQYRLGEIDTAHDETCEWILGRPEYLAWMSEESLPNHGGFFWIKGKPGAGKSTIMKYLLMNATNQLHDTILLSFFFHAQGTLLERSVMGMYRSLSYQLLHSQVPPDTKNAFFRVAKSLDRQDGELLWTKRDVKNLLSLAIKSLKERHILFLVDAVDECDQSEVEDMIAYFQELGKSAVEHKVYLRVCLASRHYPHITLDKGIELIVEDQREHEDDLRKYVETKLNGGHSIAVQRIRNIICDRADGVFLWVRLVVHSLNDAFKRGNISALEKRLEEIPDGLDNLFRDILTRDQKDIHVLIFSLQLILFGRRNLAIEEVYFAVLFEKTNVIEDYIDFELHSTTIMDRLLLDVTKGLAENAKRGKTKSRVRFIHESVRDFLLQRNGLSIIQSQGADSKSFTGMSHERLKQFCLNYISGVLPLCEPCSGKRFLVLKDRPHGERQDGSIQKAFPFLDYAIREVLEHSDSAQAENISQDEFLDAYSSRFSDFKRVYNAVEKYATRHYKDDWSLLYVLAHNKLNYLTQAQVLRESNAWDSGGQYLCPMGVAFRNGNMASVRALLGLQPDSQKQGSGIAIEPQMITRMKQFLIEFDGPKKRPESKNKNSRRLLSFAIEGQCISILRLLLLTNLVDFNDNVKIGRSSPLTWAILKREPDLVEFLTSEAKVSMQPHINKAKNIKSHDLRAAFRSNSESSTSPAMDSFQFTVADRQIINILLRQDSLDLKCQDQNGMNAVHWAALADDELSLKRFIKRGFDYQHCDSTGRDPLSHAAEHGHVNIVKALLEIEEIEVNRRDETGRTPFTWAVTAKKAHPIEQTKLVIENMFGANRVDFNVRDKSLKSPLAGAVEACNSEEVQILLRFASIDVNIRDKYGRTSLITAVIMQNPVITEHLLRCDRVDIDAQDTDGRTAFSWAIGPLNFLNSLGPDNCYVTVPSDNRGRSVIVIKLLLALRTPDTSLADNWGHSPTWWEGAYRIAIAELGYQLFWESIKLETRPSLKSLLEDPHSRPGCATRVQCMRSETIKSDMQRFLSGNATLKSPVKFDLRYEKVRFGADLVLEGTQIQVKREFFSLY